MKPFLTLLLAGAVAFAAAPAVPNADGKQKLVFLSDTGPIVIELNVLIDGKPFRAAHAAFIDELFRSLDRDKDGVLSKKESAAAPSPQVLAGPAGGFGGVRAGGGKSPLADRATRDDLAAHYTKNGLPAFSLSFTPKQTGVIILNNLGKENASADAINARLFELLDADRDGRLSKKELTAAATILGRLDDDEDEMLTSGELQGKGSPRPTDDGADVFIYSGEGGPAPTDRPLVAVGDDGVSPELGKRLLARYGKKGAKGLKPEEIPLPDGAFRQLDRDEDGRLDAGELARVGTLPADAAFTVRLGKRPGKEPIVEAGRANESVKLTPSGDGALLEVGKVKLELRGPKEEDFKVNVNFSAREQYINFFRTADKDNNGYLDKEEVKSSPFLNSLYAAMDEDGDGQLFEKEMLAYVDRVEGLRQRASQSCLTLSVRDDGKGLFELLDLDGDGRLSVREARQAARLLDKLDADRDGALARAEVPKRYKGTFDLGAASGGNGGRTAVVFRAGMETTTGPAAKTKGPVWFRKMDRNRDGDLSRREWLGDEADFRAADADGDGLISLAEAERYDEAKRPGRE